MIRKKTKDFFEFCVVVTFYEMSVSNDNSDDSSSTTNDEVFSSLKLVDGGETDFEKIPKPDDIRFN